MIVLSPIVIFAAVLIVTDAPAPVVLDNLPRIVVAVLGIVLTTAPALLLSFRLPYGLFATVWLVPLYSTVLATTSVFVAKFSGYVLVPPIFSVALLLTVRFPPEVNLFAVKELISSMPFDTIRSPAILIFVTKDTEPEEFVTLISLKLVTKVPPIVCVLVPLKNIVEVPAAKAPVPALFIQFPPTSMENPLGFNVPAVTVRLFTTVVAAGIIKPFALLSVRL